jgi:hypothetical protein
LFKKTGATKFIFGGFFAGFWEFLGALKDSPAGLGTRLGGAGPFWGS